MQSIEKLIQDFPNQEELSKLPKDGGDKWNRLIFEQSPYLLQHAANPVDWYPWGEEAFAKAKTENKPVMLSIGYSTCHWCHVMEHECFEDSQVSELLNQHMVCIKVDREERPDIDNLYMTFAQILIKRGGWPLNIFLTPDRKPFFAATYVPKHSRQAQGGVMLGMLDLIPRVSDYWKNNQEQVLDSAEKLIGVLNQVNQNQQEYLITDDLINEIHEITFKNLSKNYDPTHAGFGSAPKFPSPHIFEFLFSYYRRTKDYKALDMAEATLMKMRMGGLFDQVGKGFHRYSTDGEWLLPHFEKMLYDQATLLTAYSDAYTLTQNPSLKQVIYEICEYLERDLKSPHGAYYSAEDADSEGEEGKFYVWSIDELKSILSKEELELTIKTFNCKPEGNFHDEATRELTGSNILHLSNIKDLQNPELQTITRKLREAREKRIRPLLDDKILLDWNALLAVGLVRAYKATLDTCFSDAAKNILNFIFKELYDSEKLHKSYRKERSSAAACINDYAFMLWALVEFHDISQDSKFLQDAIKITNTMLEDFWSTSANAFSFNAANSQEIPTQNFEFYDGAIPSANSVIFFVMNKLYGLTQNFQYKEISEKLFSSYIPKIEQYPSGYAQFITNLEPCFSDYQEQKFCGEGGCSI